MWGLAFVFEVSPPCKRELEVEEGRACQSPHPIPRVVGPRGPSLGRREKLEIVSPPGRRGTRCFCRLNELLKGRLPLRRWSWYRAGRRGKVRAERFDGG